MNEKQKKLFAMLWMEVETDTSPHKERYEAIAQANNIFYNSYQPHPSILYAGRIYILTIKLLTNVKAAMVYSDITPEEINSVLNELRSTYNRWS